MDIERCKTCKNYEKFFNSCNLYYKCVYLGDGEYGEQPVSIREIPNEDCDYEPI